MIYSQQKSTIADETLQRISELIREGNYEPGQKLPSERQLAEQLHVGRTSVREAIRRLETMGYVESRHGLGTFVKDPSNEMIRANLVPHLRTDRETMEKLFDLRMIIEVESAARAATHASALQLETMRELQHQLETHSARGELESMIVADVEFHRQLIIATGNDILVNLMDSIVDLLRDMRWSGAGIRELRPEVNSGHRAILTAVEAHDSEAARHAMRDHLTSVHSRVRASWKDDEKS